MPPLDIPRSFKRRLEKKRKKSPKLATAVYECVFRLGKDPSHPGLRTKGVRGAPGVFESYVDGANRITWEWGDDCIVLRNHCNHDIVRDNP